MMSNSALYKGRVIHTRHRPRQHQLRYRVFSMLLDLDELETLGGRLKLFGYNKSAIFSFHDKDHGPADGTSVKEWVLGKLEDAGVQTEGLRVRVLCYPRIFGFVFNPLTVYFCYRPDETVAAVLYEVTNTFRERHIYIIPVNAEGNTVHQTAEKALYVSPFMPLGCTYHFKIDLPAKRVGIRINETDDEGLVLYAGFTGTRKALTDGALLSALLTYPLMTLKVMAGIHWEAVRLWMKGLRVFPHSPAENRISSSVVLTKEGK